MSLRRCSDVWDVFSYCIGGVENVMEGADHLWRRLWHLHSFLWVLRPPSGALVTSAHFFCLYGDAKLRLKVTGSHILSSTNVYKAIQMMFKFKRRRSFVFHWLQPRRSSGLIILDLVGKRPEQNMSELKETQSERDLRIIRSGLNLEREHQLAAAWCSTN